VPQAEVLVFGRCQSIGSHAADRNVGVFDSPEVVRSFAQGYDALVGDVGERLVLHELAPLVRGLPILDVGVGAGRTSWSLRLLSDSYVAIDAAPRMVELCRHNHPGVDVRLADVRDLTAWPEGSFGLTLFSNNGLDVLDHAGRARALRELARVTQPGGYVVYPTHNLQGASYRDRPWQLHRTGEPLRREPGAAVRQVARVVRHRDTYLATYRNYLRGRRHRERHADWAMGPLRAHGYQLVVHFVTVRGIAAEVAAAGLTLVALRSLEGRALEVAGPASDTHYIHVVARKEA
jgi:SAM-dependent methyltransferase